ncbi:MAG: HipA domain-containing protein [Ignavibacteriaceae bacterium]|nr:HipA domain-containing protein [Ignavibacteriaceae bacterium]
MNRCPLSYAEIADGLYSDKGLKKLNVRLKNLKKLDFTTEELLEEAASRSDKISLDGVQPKLSAILSVSESAFKFVDTKGIFIIKPQQLIYPHIPENEDLTMRLAQKSGIDVPLHGLLYDKTLTLHYFIRRFDRPKPNVKYQVEDFAQLSGKNRNTKYDSSMEQVASLIEKYCTFPAIEKVKLFRLTLFNFLTGNEDMHLKNYSVITKDDITSLSPAYDLLNTTIALKNTKEEIALPVKGKKSNLTGNDLIVYFGKERLQLNDQTISLVLNELKEIIPEWETEIGISFLSKESKEAYVDLLNNRWTLIK